MKNKKFIISLIVLLVVAGCLLAGLWYMNNRNQQNANENKNSVDSNNLVFDESKIINKNDNFTYNLSEANTVLLTKKADGYYLNKVYDQAIDGKTGTVEFKITGGYTDAILGTVDEGGAGTDSFFAVLLNTNGNVYYVNYVNFVENNKIDIKSVATITDAKKLYVASCTNKDQTGEFYDGRDTILVQKADGSIIDLFDTLNNYVY